MTYKTTERSITRYYGQSSKIDFCRGLDVPESVIPLMREVAKKKVGWFRKRLRLITTIGAMLVGAGVGHLLISHGWLLGAF